MQSSGTASAMLACMIAHKVISQHPWPTAPPTAHLIHPQGVTLVPNSVAARQLAGIVTFACIQFPNLTIRDSFVHPYDMSHGAGILWTGHNDGKICAFALDAKPGVALTGRTLNTWQAHRIGSVTVLVTTPWGELWSGSSRGIIRVWRNAHKQGGGTAPVLSTPVSCACSPLDCVIAWYGRA